MKMGKKERYRSIGPKQITSTVKSSDYNKTHSTSVNKEMSGREMNRQLYKLQTTRKTKEDEIDVTIKTKQSKG